MAYPGTFALIVGASGSGKGALLKHARAAHPEIVFPVSCTTRAMRPGEKDGETYYFVSDEEFTNRIEAEEFLEWAEYGGARYGTLKSEITAPLEEGKLVMREVDVQGVHQLRTILPPENLVSIYIHAGAWEDVERRIRGRAPISEEELALRKHRYEEEEPFMREATYVVENLDGKFKEADAAFEGIIQKLLPSA